MCCVPCGPKRSSRRVYREVVESETITKSEAESVIFSEEYDCLCRNTGETTCSPYEGCKPNLSLILHDGRTRVKVVGSRSNDYASGFRTVVMTAPCVGATFIFRKEI